MGRLLRFASLGSALALGSCFSEPSDQGGSTDATGDPSGSTSTTAVADASSGPSTATTAGTTQPVDTETTTSGLTSSGVDSSTGPQSDCGDGEVQDGEECDDENRRAGDGCDAECRLEFTQLCYVAYIGGNPNARIASFPIFPGNTAIGPAIEVATALAPHNVAASDLKEEMATVIERTGFFVLGDSETGNPIAQITVAADGTLSNVSASPEIPGIRAVVAHPTARALLVLQDRWQRDGAAGIVAASYPLNEMQELAEPDELIAPLKGDFTFRRIKPSLDPEAGILWSAASSTDQAVRTRISRTTFDAQGGLTDHATYELTDSYEPIKRLAAVPQTQSLWLTRSRPNNVKTGPLCFRRYEISAQNTLTDFTADATHCSDGPAWGGYFELEPLSGNRLLLAGGTINGNLRVLSFDQSGMKFTEDAVLQNGSPTQFIKRLDEEHFLVSGRFGIRMITLDERGLTVTDSRTFLEEPELNFDHVAYQAGFTLPCSPDA